MNKYYSPPPKKFILKTEDIFNEQFLKEKDKALKPIILDDEIISETDTDINEKNSKGSKETKQAKKVKSLNKKNRKGSSKKINKDSKNNFNSNIIIVQSNRDDKDIDECPVLKELKKVMESGKCDKGNFSPKSPKRKSSPRSKSRSNSKSKKKKKK